MTLDPFRESIHAGDVALHQGALADAAAQYAAALACANTDSEIAEALCWQGRVAGIQGRYAEAERDLQEAVRRGQGDTLVATNAVAQLGILRWRLGNLTSARILLEQAQQGFRQLGLLRDRSAALSNLALVLIAEGEYQRAIDALTQSVAVLETLGDQARVITGCNNLGEIYLVLGALAPARALFERALALTEAIAAPVRGIDPLRNLGRVQAGEGNLVEGQATIERALQLAEQYQREYLRTQAQVSLADVLLTRGDAARAEALARDLLARAGGETLRRAEARLLLGRARLMQGDQGEALAVLQEGLLDAQASFSKLDTLRLHAALAELSAQPALAAIHFRMARELAIQIADGLSERALQEVFLHSEWVAGLMRGA